MRVRFARHTDQLADVVEFYRDRLGLPEIGSFEDHDGYDGVFLALPGTNAHLEFTSGGEHRAAPPHPETLLVLYLGSTEAVAEAKERLAAEPVAAANRYWQTRGIAFADPDGYQVVLVAGSGPAT
ncbi:MAG: VOC family protein [Actinobacteria bacterium]|nr:VOC family protein [Actinomycetota bacterium]